MVKHKRSEATERERQLRAELLSRAKKYAAITGLALSGVSLAAARDSKFFGLLECGKLSPTIKKFGEVLEWFDDNWPATR